MHFAAVSLQPAGGISSKNVFSLLGEKIRSNAVRESRKGTSQHDSIREASPIHCRWLFAMFNNPGNAMIQIQK